jgi:hypothetical protein
MDGKSADLGCYIENCHYGDSTPFFRRNSIFDMGITHIRPRLDKSRTNRILVYPGSFNPPHHGHLALLGHAFASSCDDINVIAAIILPLDDKDVDRKCRAVGEDLVLTKDQRVRLWLGECGRQDWYWVYDRSVRKWESFRHRLLDAVTQDGFDLKFVLLCGPDYLKLASPPPWRACDCDEIIVSDISRSADFRNRDGSLRQLKGCDSWKRVLYDNEEVSRRAKQMASWLMSGMSLLSPTILKERLKQG